MTATHVYPAQQHNTDGYDCPACQPEYFRLCDEEHPTADSCWKCSPRGMIAITREEAEATDEPVIIVHAP